MRVGGPRGASATALDMDDDDAGTGVVGMEDDDGGGNDVEVAAVEKAPSGEIANSLSEVGRQAGPSGDVEMDVRKKHYTDSHSEFMKVTYCV